MIDTIKEIFSRDGHISEIDDELVEDVNNIKFHYAGADGINTNQIVIREYRNGHTGDILLIVEFKPIDDKWVIRDKRNKLATVSGEENYSELAEEIAQQLRD